MTIATCGARLYHAAACTLRQPHIERPGCSIGRRTALEPSLRSCNQTPHYPGEGGCGVCVGGGFNWRSGRGHPELHSFVNMPTNLPEALASRFAVTVRDVLCFETALSDWSCAVAYLPRSWQTSDANPLYQRSRSVCASSTCLNRAAPQVLGVLEHLLAEISEYSDLSHLNPVKAEDRSRVPSRAES